MDQMTTMVRTTVMIDGRSHLLSQNQDVDVLKHGVEDAAAAGSRYVDFFVVGNRSVSVLITASSQVVVPTGAVPFDRRDDGDVDVPYGGISDL